MTSCLIPIDLMGDFLAHLDHAEVERILVATNALAAGFRGAGLPVIWVRQEFAPDLSDAFLDMRKRGIRTAIAGTAGAQIDPRLDVRPEDPVIVKRRYSAFYGTDLDAVLARLGVDELVLAGVNTHACIRMAAIDAYQRDLKVVLAAECLGSHDAEHAAVSLRYMDGKIARVLSNAEIFARIG